MKKIELPPEVAQATKKPQAPVTISGSLFTGEISKEDIATCNRLYQEKAYQTGYDFSKQLLTKQPKSRVAKLSLAKAAIKLNKLDLAFTILFTALQNNPNDTQACDILASAYTAVNRNEEALIYAKRAVEYEPTNASFHVNLALHYFNAGLFDDALIHYQQSVALADLPGAYLGIAFTLLAMRRYPEGWAAHEERFRIPENTRPIRLEIPFWDKIAPLEGKNIIITWEQGIGDNIQFMRFIPLLKQRYNPKISIACGNSIAKLCKTLPNIERVIAGKYLIFPPMDYQINMLSLPYMLDINDEAEFFREPYIVADPVIVEKWCKTLSKTDRPRVGFCWRGRVDYNNSTKRDCTLDYFLSLLAHPDINLVSLQRGLSADEAEILDYSDIVSLGDKVTDLIDTAAVIASLDLVITVDTGVAHLAGAMGKPVWTLIRYETEWRHPRDCDISPWYPSMRLFRQAKSGDWDSVFEAVHKALADLV